MHYLAMYLGVFVITSLLWMFFHIFHEVVNNTITRIALAIIEDLLAAVSLSALLATIFILTIYFGGNQ
jgi:hypothetical protein